MGIADAAGACFLFASPLPVLCVRLLRHYLLLLKIFAMP